MSSRTLETILTGRNLLSPVLASAARDVASFDATVAAGNKKAATSATTSARAQATAAGQVVQASARVTDAVVTGSTRQVAARRTAMDSASALAGAERASATAVVQANAQVSAAVSGTSATYQRSAASLREKLGMQALDGAAAERSAAANSRAAASAAVFTRAIDSNSSALARDTGSATASTAAVRANTVAREQASVAARAQQTAVGALTASNGLLGSSLTPLTAGLGAVTLGLGYAAFRGMAFGGAMAEARAASGATGAEFEQLRDTAVELGADTKFSSEEAAQGITEMAKAGVSTADILSGGLKGALDLAAAGQMDVADAAELGATAMNVFNLEGDQMSHVADLLAAGAGKAQGSVHDMGMALNQSALVAAQAGLSIEDTAGALAMFASNGLVGSDAGTSFKTMLQALTPNSEAAARAMDAIGFSAYDAQGNFVGLEAVAGQLQTGLAGLSEEQRAATLETIFGSDAVRAASVLYAEGAAGVNEWAGAVNDAGYAARTAAALSDYLGGDLEKLGGAVDAVATNVGDAAQGPLRLIVQVLTDLVDIGGDVLGFWNDLPGPVQTAVLAFAGFKLLKGPLDGFFGSVVGWLFRTEINLRESIKSAGGFRGALAGMAKSAGPTVVLTGAITALTYAMGQGERTTAEMKSTADDLFGTLREGGAAAAQARVQLEGLQEFSERMGDKTFLGFGTDFTEGMEQAEQAARAYWDALSPLEQAQSKVTQWTNELSYALEHNGEGSEEARTATERLAYWTDLQADRQHALDVATADSTNTMAAAASASGDYTNALIWIGDATGLTQEQIEAATDAVNDWRDTLAGIQGAFVDPLAVYTGQVQAMAQATADATEDSTDSWEDYAADTKVSLDDVGDQLEAQIMAQANWRDNIVLATQRGGLEVGQALAAMGIEGAGFVQQMVDATDEDFARMAGLMAENARLGGDQAAAELDSRMRVMAEVGRLGSQATVQGIAYELGIGADAVRFIASQYGLNLAEGINPVLAAVGQPTMNLLQYNGAYVPNRATGGPIEGPGTGTSDSILGVDPAAGVPTAWVSNGEFVTNAREYERNRALVEAVNAGRVPAGVDPDDLQYLAGGGFVSVGAVPRPPSTAPAQHPISTGADGTMAKGYNAVTAWLPQHLEPPPGSGGSSTGLTANMAAARQYAMDTYGVRNIGGFARRNIAGTNTLSRHATGQAIDIMTSDLKLGWAIARDFSSGFAAKKFNIENTIWQQSISSNGGPFKGMADRGSPTQNHRDHVHADSRFDRGGVAHGIGYLPKATIAPERVLDPRQTAAFEDWMRSPAAMPGYGMGGGYGGGGTLTVTPNVTVEAHVFLGDREITDIVRVEARTVVDGRLADVQRQAMRR